MLCIPWRTRRGNSRLIRTRIFHSNRIHASMGNNHKPLKRLCSSKLGKWKIMAALRYLLLVVFCIDAFLLMGQYAAHQINPDGTTFTSYEGSITSSFDQGGNCYGTGNCVVNENVAGQLPTGSSSISPTTGNIFTDAFSTVKSWLFSLPGVNYVIAAANALPNWLKSFGLPAFFAFAISTIWHMYAVWLLVEFLVGRQ